jgi:hypothetical protein
MIRILIFIMSVTATSLDARAESRPTQLGPLFSDMIDCYSEPPPGYAVLPKGQRCEITDTVASPKLQYSILSSVPCGCSKSTDGRTAELKCVVGGPAEITITTGESRKFFVGRNDLGFLRATGTGKVACRATRFKDTNEILKLFDTLVPLPAN